MQGSAFWILVHVFIGGLFLGMQGCAHPSLRYAEELAANGQWDAAINAYRDLLREDPFNDDLTRRLNEVKTRAAQAHYAKGREWLKANKLSEALQELQIALALNPEHAEYHAALADVLRLKDARRALEEGRKLHMLGRFDEALQQYERAVELDPSLTAALDGITAVAQQQQAQVALGENTEPVTLRFQNTRLKQVFEILARTANIDIIFDKDVRDDLITIFTRDTPFEEALNLILSTNQLFAQRVGPKTLLIIPDTKQKREQYQDLQIRTFYLSNAKAKDVANMLRTILETKRVYVNEPLNTVVIRDEPSKLQLAEQVILANDRRDGEVQLDVEVLEVNRTKTKRIGLSFAKQVGAGIFPPGTTAFSNALQTFTFRQLTSIGPDSYLFTFPGSILLEFFKQESDAKTLAAPKIRVLNNQKATINIGDKQPILLSTTNVLPGQAATGAVPTTSTVTSIEFKDTGIKLTVEPTIHLNEEISLRLQIEVTRLGDRVVLQAEPEISQFRFGTRTADTALNLKDGETVVIAGLLQEEDRRSREAVPGLDEVPGLKDLLSSTNKEKITTEVILVITPHIIRSVTPPDLAKQTLWSGTAKQFSTKPLFSKPAKPSPLTLPTIVPEEEAKQPGREDGHLRSEANVQAPDVATVAARLELQPAELQATVGDTVHMVLTGQALPPMEQARMTLVYNPLVVEFVKASEGALWTDKKVSANLTVSAVPALGKIVLQMGQKGRPVGGTGPLATLTFRAKAQGQSPIDIQHAVLNSQDDTPIPVIMKSATILVQE
ncbi:MAG: hypothetical protein D6690_12240 [Nitrospirae bacterium]|nr:MAG: hypothetical protein D6690_12240 [Nitrospirota bacterium]